MKTTVIQSDAPRPLVNYSECVVAGPFVFAAGQIASDYKTGIPPEARTDPAFPYYGSDIAKRTTSWATSPRPSRRPGPPWMTSSRPRFS